MTRNWREWLIRRLLLKLRLETTLSSSHLALVRGGSVSMHALRSYCRSLICCTDWTSEVGRVDATNHNNTDFLPWFLTQMKTASQKAGKRLLDYLDLHYYYQADTSAGDAAAEALRLRMTRSLWDPTYVDESWIGTSTPQNFQPNATIVQLIPRIKALIQKYYPGTKFSVSEWSASGDTDIVGGLVAADSLGIFGKFGLDAATYWGTVTNTNAIGLAFWLYNG
jgi:hypothetical protein